MFIEEKNINFLRQKALKAYGKTRLGADDCRVISQEAMRLGFRVHPQTYRRFFQLVKYEGGFSEYTLESLAAYCGYKSYGDFKKSLINNELGAFFESSSAEGDEDHFWLLSEGLCRRIAASPSLLVSVHHELMKYPMARKFFIENHPMRDLVCTVYAQYFQEYLKYDDSTEARLFAYGFLFMGAFLSENEEYMKMYYREITELEADSSIFLLPAGRKHGVQLLYAWLHNDEPLFAQYYDAMLAAREIFREQSEKSVCSFEYTVLEHLVFTDKTAEMLFLIENNTLQKYPDRSFIPQSRKENHEEVWKILCATAYHKAGDAVKAKDYLSQVSLEKLSFGWVKYYSIMYYDTLLKYCNSEERAMISEKMNRLLSETYFDYYKIRRGLSLPD